MKIEQIKDETIIDLKRTLTECCCNKKAFCLTEFILSFNGYDSQTLYKKGVEGISAKYILFHHYFVSHHNSYLFFRFSADVKEPGIC